MIEFKTIIYWGREKVSKSQKILNVLKCHRNYKYYFFKYQNKLQMHRICGRYYINSVMELLMIFQRLLSVFQTFIFLMFLGEAYALNEHGSISLIHGQSFNFILGTNATSAETSSLYVFRGPLHLMLTWDSSHTNFG